MSLAYDPEDIKKTAPLDRSRLKLGLNQEDQKQTEAMIRPQMPAPVNLTPPSGFNSAVELAPSSSSFETTAKQDSRENDDRPEADDLTATLRFAKKEEPQTTKYRILKELDAGGMGCIYLAEEKKTDRRVVIKRLLLQTDMLKRRFRREAEALKLVRHDNLVKIFDYDVDRGLFPGWEDEGVVILVLEFVEGQNLKNLIDQELRKNNRLPDFEWTVKVFSDLAMALKTCHDAGLVHRDFKPANVIIEKATDRAVLIDFGLVKMTDSELRADLSAFQESMTKTGQALGTPLYMAPEQILAEKDKIGQGTDTWGFGASLMFTLTGQYPYLFSSRAELQLSVREGVKPKLPHDFDPSLPAWIQELCQQCLQLDPNKRPSMAEVVELMENRSKSSKLSKWLLALGLVNVFIAVVITLIFLKDRHPPKFELSSTVTTVKDNWVTLTGLVTDKNPSHMLARLKGQRQAKRYPVGKDGRFDIKVELKDGANNLGLIAVDGAGNQSPLQSYVIEVDKTPPRFKWQAAPPKSTHALTFEGTVLCAEDGCQVSVNGAEVNGDKRAFPVSVKLKKGSQELTVVVTDQAGNVSKASFRLVRYPTVGVRHRALAGSYDGQFQSLKEAVASVNEYTRIVVGPGTYTQLLEVNKSLEIVAAPGLKERPILEDNGGSTCLEMQDDTEKKDKDLKVVVRGFEIFGHKGAISNAAVRLGVGRFEFENCRIHSTIGPALGTFDLEDKNLCRVLLKRCEFSKTQQGTSGVLAKKNAHITIESCEFLNMNSAAVSLQRGSHGLIKNTTFDSCGIAVDMQKDTELSMKDCVIRYCRTGGVWVDDSETTVLAHKCRFIGNGLSNRVRGAAIFARGGTIEAVNCHFEKNSFGVRALGAAQVRLVDPIKVGEHPLVHPEGRDKVEIQER